MPDKIYKYLASFRKKEVFFFPNPGNAGDSLINYSTYQHFEKANVEYRMVTESDDLNGKYVIYGGGGNFVSYYDNASRFIQKWHRSAARLTVLSSTINSNADLLSELGNNVDIICREKVSYAYVKKLASRANVFLMNDMGFHLDLQPFQEWQRQKPVNFNDVTVRNLLRFLSEERVFESRTLNSFRIDKESTGIAIPFGNIDIAKLLESSDMGRASAQSVSFYLLYFLSYFDQINTNRLHVCIAGCLLGKKVHFYPNSYYKNKAVYDYTIKRHFKNVKWVSQDD